MRSHLVEEVREQHSFISAQGVPIVFQPKKALDDIVQTVELGRGRHFRSPHELIRDVINTRSADHAHWLFFTVSNDYRQQSSGIYAPFKKAYEKNPELVNPEIIVGLDKWGLMGSLISQGIYLSPTYKHERMVLNAHKLMNDHDGDIRNLAKRTGRVQNIQEQLIQFYGLGPQTSTLLLGWFVNEGIVSVDDEENLSIKVDTHKMRWPFMQGWYSANHPYPWMLSKDRYSLTNKLSSMYNNMLLLAAKKMGSNYREVRETFDNFVWGLSEQRCSQQRIGVCKSCPLYDSCQGRPYHDRRQRVHKTPTATRHTHSLNLEGGHSGFVAKPVARLFTDKRSGKQIMPVQDHLYFFTDTRVDDIGNGHSNVQQHHLF